MLTGGGAASRARLVCSVAADKACLHVHLPPLSAAAKCPQPAIPLHPRLIPPPRCTPCLLASPTRSSLTGESEPQERYPDLARDSNGKLITVRGVCGEGQAAGAFVAWAATSARASQLARVPYCVLDRQPSTPASCHSRWPAPSAHRLLAKVPVATTNLCSTPSCAPPLTFAATILLSCRCLWKPPTCASSPPLSPPGRAAAWSSARATGEPCMPARLLQVPRCTPGLRCRSCVARLPALPLTSQCGCRRLSHPAPCCHAAPRCSTVMGQIAGLASESGNNDKTQFQQEVDVFIKIISVVAIIIGTRRSSSGCGSASQRPPHGTSTSAVGRASSGGGAPVSWLGRTLCLVAPRPPSATAPLFIVGRAEGAGGAGVSAHACSLTAASLRAPCPPPRRRCDLCADRHFRRQGLPHRNDCVCHRCALLPRGCLAPIAPCALHCPGRHLCRGGDALRAGAVRGGVPARPMRTVNNCFPSRCRRPAQASSWAPCPRACW